MRRGCCVTFVALIGALAFCQEPAPKAMAEPALPFFDWKVCPFEGCAYRDWTAAKSIIVYDTWKRSRREIARLSKGDRVTGITGVVITYKPGVVRMDRDLPEQNLKQGDRILTYTYIGEGYAKVWFQGRFYSEFDLSFVKEPDGNGCSGAHCAASLVEPGKQVWWAEIKLESGRNGWVNMEEAQFDGVDMLG